MPNKRKEDWERIFKPVFNKTHSMKFMSVIMALCNPTNSWEGQAKDLSVSANTFLLPPLDLHPFIGSCLSAAVLTISALTLGPESENPFHDLLLGFALAQRADHGHGPCGLVLPAGAPVGFGHAKHLCCWQELICPNWEEPGEIL